MRFTMRIYYMRLIISMYTRLTMNTYIRHMTNNLVNLYHVGNGVISFFFSSSSGQLCSRLRKRKKCFKPETAGAFFFFQVN